MLKPQKLQAGDTVATVSLSWGGPGTIPHRYAAGKRQLEKTFGLRVVETPHALADAKWLERNPRARADDLLAAFSDPAIKGIISTIGGDDSIRLLPYLDLDAIRTNPKVFMGYSDTTVTHLACFKAGLVSFYGPSIMAGFAENGGVFPYTIDAIRKTLFSTGPVGRIEPNRDGWTVERLDWADPSVQSQRRCLQRSESWRFLQGTRCARGPLIGGCLEVLDWLRGTPVWPELAKWEDAILFIETSEEAPSPQYVARTLRSFAAMGVLERISALLVGRPGGGVLENEFAAYDEAILEVVTTEQGLSDLPIVSRMDFGHTDPMCVLPYGIRAEVNCERQEVALLESAVSDAVE
ncbi:MAG: LD-carboxypeptidase [Candidatus Hydrogenedentes bacterium]|nr:LD-carboxypeptidase [Candidatus Hydrogenedentota bacterium]